MDRETNVRGFTRIRVHVRARLKTRQGVIVHGSVENLSMNGVYVVSESRLPMGTECEIALLLNDDEAFSPLAVMGVVARVDDGGLAVEFTSIAPENLEHLHNMVVYNAPDAAEVEQEIEDSVGLKRLTPPRC